MFIESNTIQHLDYLLLNKTNINIKQIFKLFTYVFYTYIILI